MDSAVTTANSPNHESNAGDEQTHQRTVRSASHGRPPSASGIRSKIPTNINHNRPASSIANTQITACTQDDSANSITPGNATRRLTRSHNSALSKSKVQGITSGGMQKRWLESQFKKEKKKYLTIKKELDEKQKCAQQIYDDMTQLREKLMADGGKDLGKLEEIKLIFDMTDKQSGDQNTNRGSGESGFVINGTINEEFISIIENEIKNYPKDCLVLCEDVMKNHSEALKWLENCGKSEKFGKEINQHVDKYNKDLEIFNKRFESGKKLLDEFNIKFVTKVDTMWMEIQALRSRIKHLETVSDDVVNNLRTKMNMEMEKFNELKERKATVDNELTKSKARIQALVTRVDADNVKMVQLQSHLKNLESQLKQKDINLEHDTRDLHKSLKHSEETIVNLETEKIELEMRLRELNEKFEKEKNVERSPRIQEIKPPIENDIERDDTKKKVEGLEALVETLRAEVACNKELIVKLQNEKSSSEIKLKEELAKEQAQTNKIMENYEQLKKEHESTQKTRTQDTHKQILVSHRDDYDIKNINQDLNSIDLIQLTETLRQEIIDLKRKNKDLEKQQQVLMEKLQIKNQMITYLKDSHSNENSDMHQVNKTDSKAEALQELYATLETKQMQLTHLENVLKQMEGQEIRNQEQRTRYEKRIAQLEYDAQIRKNKDCRYVYDHSKSHSSSKQNEVAKALELERKYQRLKKESCQMEYIYKKLLEPTVKIEKPRNLRHSHGSHRDREYTCCQSVKPQSQYVDIGCYVHQIVDECGRELGAGCNSNGRQKFGYSNRSPNRIRRKITSKGESIVRGHQ